MKDWG